MNQILATIKCPADEVPHIREQLQELGVNMIEEQKVPYEQFIEESRMNYDCVYQQAWEEKRLSLICIFLLMIQRKAGSKAIL